MFGAKRANDGPWDPAIAPEEAWNIDTKMDDGRPGYGRVTSQRSSSAATPDCATSSAEATAEYELTISGNQCNLFFSLE